MDATDQPKRRGFASLPPERRREIARKGGENAQATGRAHRFTSEEARAAGKKGGAAAQAAGRAHRFTPAEAREAGRLGGEAASRDTERMAEIGRKGGRERWRRKRERDQP